VLRPHELLPYAARSPAHRRAELPALAALIEAIPLLAPFGLPWGPGGSLGFELATGVPTAHPASDLDLVVRADEPVSADTAAGLLEALRRLPARTDALLETPHGAVALAEYAHHPSGPVLLRTGNGPRLTADPWSPPARQPGRPSAPATSME
jgi:phosphoribosyl-dephospho-CoA transferase